MTGVKSSVSGLEAQQAVWYSPALVLERLPGRRECPGQPRAGMRLTTSSTTGLLSVGSTLVLTASADPA